MEILFESLTPENFPDLFTLLWISALAIVIGAVVVYTDSGRRYRRYPVLLAMHEWLFWSVIIPWTLVPLLVITHVPLIMVLIIVLPGMAVMLWARFIRFPPRILAANEELRRRRFTPTARGEPRGRTRPTPAGRRRRHIARR